MNKTYNKERAAKVRKVAVRVTNWVGDAVMNTPALHAVRATFPAAEIVVIANPVTAQLFSPHPGCDRVIVFDKKDKDQGIAGFLRFTSRLRREKFDVAILLQKAIEAALMAFLAGIPVRIGYKTDFRGFMLTHGVSFGADIQRQHHVNHFLHLLKSCGISAADPGQTLQITPEETAWAATVLGDRDWVAINPGAAYGSAKRWLPERFARVADEIADLYGMNVLLIGGPGEMDIGHEIEHIMTTSPINFTGKTTIREMMALVSGRRLMVTNDSGPMHVAAALQVPIVAVFGSTDHTTTHPYGVDYRIVRKEVECAPCLLRQCPIDHRCMTSIHARDVMEAVASILGSS